MKWGAVYAVSPSVTYSLTERHTRINTRTHTHSLCLSLSLGAVCSL
jgi:hypothetical protein